MYMRVNYDNLYHKITLILVFLLIIALITPIATPEDRGVDSKEALSFVWIWGLCYGQGEFFYLKSPFVIISCILIQNIITLLSLVIIILVNSLYINNKKRTIDNL